MLFAALTVVTTANANGVPLFQFLIDPFRTQITGQDVTDALPAALAFWFALGEGPRRCCGEEGGETEGGWVSLTSGKACHAPSSSCSDCTTNSSLTQDRRDLIWGQSVLRIPERSDCAACIAV